MRDRKLPRVEHGRIAEHADLSANSGPQCNDMVIDAADRAFVGTIDFTAFAELPATNLLRADPDGSVAVAAGGLSFPNGMVITPDAATLIVAESWAQRLTAFDLQPDGSLASRRVWAPWARQMPQAPPGSPCSPEGGTARPTESR